ncbi:DUF7660 family protein [Caulobacter sp. DWR1-3-2b1]|uniref:DUF7660 family protein n=1 Tax=Caulobacter sp. DWR1-3-2b1 TaxID=2804670 RepID=UPI003CF9CD4C
MFGGKSKANFDGEALAERASTIETREDFSQFAKLLSQNYKKRKREWENDKLESYLEGVAAFSSDFDGYVLNMGNDAAANPWRLLATVLLAAKVYE